MKLTVIVPIFLDKAQATKVKVLVEKNCKIPIIFLNNRTIFKYKWAINNEVNGGKFWSVIKNLDLINTDYFLTIDPDDILNESIDWKILNDLNKYLVNHNFSFGVNSYIEIRDGSSYKVECDEFNKIFNACAIYNTKHLKEMIGNAGIEWDGKEQTYYEDFIMCVASSLRGNVELIDFPFYGYNYRAGISKDWTLFREQIKLAWNKMEKLINKYGIEEIDEKIRERIININIKRVKERGKK